MAAFVTAATTTTFSGNAIGTPPTTLATRRKTTPTNTPRMSAMRSAQLAVLLAGSASNGYIDGRGTTNSILNKADEYMARCVTRQYQMAACPAGVYTVACTEGTTHLQAEDSRVLSMGIAFRAKQVPLIAQHGTTFDKRRRAVQLAHGCSYEEGLHVRYAAAASATITGSAEAMGVCGRLAIPVAGREEEETIAESYMAQCVEQQCKRQAVPFGEYGTMCTDGTVSGMAEYRRVTALSAKYRSAQWSKIARAQREYDSAKRGRDMFALGCSYEEDLYKRFPATAMAMSGMGSKY